MRNKKMVAGISIALIVVVFGGMAFFRVSVPLPKNIKMTDPTTHDMKRGRVY